MGQESGFSFEDNDLLHAKPLIRKGIEEGGKIMKTIIGMLLVGLLGFLGCSDSDDATNTVGSAIPVAPFGIIDTPTPTYEWAPVQGATKYRLFVQDTNQSPTLAYTSEPAVIDEWYTAEEAGCGSEDGLCMVTPEAEVIGKNEFQVQACTNQECGLWSEQLNFDFTAINAPRFTDNGDGTVTDNKTQLMWTKNADLCGRKNWHDAISYCEGVTIAGESDWVLAHVLDLRSLLDELGFPPTNPPLEDTFTNVQSYYYWSRTSCNYVFNAAYGVSFHTGFVDIAGKGYEACVWCVRGGN